MTIAQDRARYFWLKSAGDAVTATEPEPATFDQSLVTPCIDMEQYAAKLVAALDQVGVSADPAANKGDFIYIASWWCGLLGGPYRVPDKGSATGLTVDEHGDPGGNAQMTAFDLDPLAPENRLIEVLKAKARLGVDVRIMVWVSYALNSLNPVPLPLLGITFNHFIANSIQRKDNTRGILGLNAMGMNALKDLRLEKTIGANAVLNVVGHSGGAVHMKMALVGSKNDAAGKSKCIGFTGGMDFVEDRWARRGHPLLPSDWDRAPPVLRWHDAAAAVEGKAAQGLYDTFRRMWNENMKRDIQIFAFEAKKIQSHFETTTPVPERNVELPLLSTAAALTHHVQSLNTVPAFNYKWYNCLPQGKAASFAPDGLFEVRAAWRKAILNASSYIYIEDQSFQSREVMEWINQALRSNPDLKVIFSFSGQGDPNDAPRDDSEINHEAMNLGLLGVPPGPGEPPGNSQPLNAAQIDRIRIFRHWGERQALLKPDSFDVEQILLIDAVGTGPGEAQVTSDQFAPADIPEDALRLIGTATLANGTTEYPIIGNLATEKDRPIIFRVDTNLAGDTLPPLDLYELRWVDGIVIHAKLTLIDDKWAIMGSANVLRRSLFTDWEHSVAFMDEAGTAVRDLRARLWSEHFQSTADLFTDLTKALGAWEPTWNPAGGSPPMPVRVGPGRPFLDPIDVRDFPKVPMTEATRHAVDLYVDVDSREAWGGLKP